MRSDSSIDRPLVLVIEDNPDLRDLVTTLLERSGYDVVGAENGSDVLSTIEDRPAPALILLDLTTPVMDGWTFCAERAHHPTLATVPLVVFSAIPPEDPRMRALDASGYLPKPADLEQILAMVRRWCAPREM